MGRCAQYNNLPYVLRLYDPVSEAWLPTPAWSEAERRAEAAACRAAETRAEREAAALRAAEARIAELTRLRG